MTNKTPPPVATGDPKKNIFKLAVADRLLNQPNPLYPQGSRGLIYHIVVRMKRDVPGGHSVFTMDELNGVKRVRKIDVVMAAPAPGLWFTSASWIATPNMQKVKIGIYEAYSYGFNETHTAHDTALGYKEGVGVSQDYWFFSHAPVISMFSATFKANNGQVTLAVGA